MEELLSFEQLAEKLGFSVEKIIEVCMEEGLLNPDGTPTMKAIEEGLLTEVVYIEDKD